MRAILRNKIEWSWMSAANSFKIQANTLIKFSAETFCFYSCGAGGRGVMFSSGSNRMVHLENWSSVGSQLWAISGSSNGHLGVYFFPGNLLLGQVNYQLVTIFLLLYYFIMTDRGFRDVIRNDIRSSQDQRLVLKETLDGTNEHLFL